MTTEMKMETRSLASLRPAEYNPRVQLQPADPEYQNIKRSIETFGYVDPIIVNQDGTIIGGHQRYNVMKDLGYTEEGCKSREVGGEPMMNQYEIMAEILRGGVRSDE